jgi:hypothetical protein
MNADKGAVATTFASDTTPESWNAFKQDLLAHERAVDSTAPDGASNDVITKLSALDIPKASVAMIGAAGKAVGRAAYNQYKRRSNRTKRQKLAKKALFRKMKEMKKLRVENEHLHLKVINLQGVIAKQDYAHTKQELEAAYYVIDQLEKMVSGVMADTETAEKAMQGYFEKNIRNIRNIREHATSGNEVLDEYVGEPGKVLVKSQLSDPYGLRQRKVKRGVLPYDADFKRGVEEGNEIARKLFGS